MQHQESTSGSSSIEAVARAMSASQAALRRRILLVAKHRFARFGYEDTSLADISNSADVSQVELLLHFENKLSILTAILEEGWDSIHPRLVDIIATSTSARLAMLSILAFMMNMIETDEEFARILLFEGRRPDPDSSEVKISDGYRRLMLTCNTLIERGQRDGSFRT